MNSTISNNHPTTGLSPCYIGVSGWSYEDWKGTVFPLTLPKTTHPIRYLAQWINCIEINVTYYRLINPSMSKNWVKQVEGDKDFLFTVKLWNKFTHEKKEHLEPQDIDSFVHSIEPILNANKLGCILIQFPYRFHRTPENRKYLAELISSLYTLPVAVEFRHKSWFHPQVLAGFRQRAIAFCNIDQPLVDSYCLPPTEEVTAEFAYVRFHGRNAEHWFSEESSRDERYNYLYSEQELDPWVERIQNIRTKAKRVFILMNNHFAGKALINAIQLREKLGYPVSTPIPYELQQIIDKEKK
ncbi:MAG TPA: DUF72 domain-containing protein [Candidatus Hydrogenedens sp.]|nr:DUF72 domain-containing protein [Candidatus Hydrogenedens sp.]HOK09785.1 DUF72 domain-containing protein [Candidatus Hydrogenedens sp.]HOL18745.1 DUF72 domain-containing protein [Candidatus Hydrogenedens sp.]HPP59105.1 DUF72 domain-containing protein [Candidatus Hydrogenedens sp.]